MAVESAEILTKRQEETLLAYGQLGSTAAVAEELNLSPNTVRNHLLEARRRLGVRFTIEAVWMARGMHLRGPGDGRTEGSL